MECEPSWAQYDHLAATYDQRIRAVLPGYDLMHELLASYVSEALKEEQSRILVIGAGTGNDVLRLAEITGKRIVAIEPSEAMISIADAKTRAANLKNVMLVRASAFEFESSQLFDTCCVSLVLQLFEIQRKRRLLSRIRHLLPPGAPLFLFDTCSRRIADAFALELRAMASHNQRTGLTAEDAVDNARSLASRFHLIPQDDVQELLIDVGYKKPEIVFRTFVTCGWICYNG